MSVENSTNNDLARFLARVQAVAAMIILLSLAGLDFFFPTSYRLQAGLHGLATISALIVGTLLTHRAYPLVRGVIPNLVSLKHWVIAAVILNFLGAISGNWMYMRYRGEGGPKDWILANVPGFQNILMEFKEFICLFPFPLMIAAGFILYYYDTALYVRRDLSRFVGIIILLAWLFILLGFVAGLVLAKLHFI